MQKHMPKRGTVWKEAAMKRMGVMLAVVLALGMGVGWFGHRRLSAQQKPVMRTVLLKTDLVGVEGKEAGIVVAEIAPGATTGKHLHAGQKFAYLLEGFLRLAVDGNPPSHPQAGGSVPAAVPSSARRPEPQRHGAGEGPGLLYCRQKPTPDHGGAPLGTPGAKP
jgi:hypothetical protein